MWRMPASCDPSIMCSAGALMLARACPRQNLLGLVPLALVLGELTEDLAVRFGEVVGGLLVCCASPGSGF